MRANLTERALVGAATVAATLLFTGCGGANGTDASSEGPASPDPTNSDVEETALPKPGQIGSDECGVTQRQIDGVVRDWTRVQDTVGRGDHALFTESLRKRLDDVAANASECDGAAAFAEFRASAQALDEQSSGRPDYDLYSAATEKGNRWLEASGLGPNALLRG